jgi:hypothetical protein
VAEHPVAKFRRVFTERLASGRYEPIDVVQAVDGLSTSAQLVDSLDVYCTLFDPPKPQKSQNAFELCRTTGFNLFLWPLKRHDPPADLVEMVRALADPKAPPLKDAKLAKRVPVYRTRYAALKNTDQDDLQRRAKKITGDRAVVARKQRYLLDDLDKAFRTTHGKAPEGDDLQWFDPGPSTSRQEFERLATACEAAWSPKGRRVAGVFVMDQFVRTPGAKPQQQSSSVAAMQNVRTAFAAFAKFVEAQIKQPIDLFRLLSWASEPENPYLQLRVRHAPNVPVASRAWSAVWPELYQDIATRGLYVALSGWHIDQMRGPRNYVGKDLQFVLAKLKGRGRALLDRRLPESSKAPKPFAAAQDGRRRAKVWGDVKGLEIVDELQAEVLMKEMLRDFEEHAKAVLSRKIYIHSSKDIYRGWYWIYQNVSDAFTIVWIPRGAASSLAYVEVPAIPGIMFKARGDRVGLEGLIEDKLFSVLAENAAALTQFLLAYLMVVGYVIDVITAGATGGLRVVVLRFIEERIKDKIISEGLQIAGIDNPWVQTLAGFAGGFIPSRIKAPKVGAVKAIDELERAEKNALRGAPFQPPKAKGPVPVPTVKPGVQAAPDVTPKPDVVKLGPRTEMVGDSLFVLEKGAASSLAGQTAKATKDAPKVPGWTTRAKDYVVDVADRALDRVVRPVGQTAGGGLLATRLSTKGVSPGVGGGSGAGSRAIEAASRAVERLRKSSDYKLLLEYEKRIMASWEKLESQKARQAIVAALERSGGNKAAEKEAIGQLRASLNKAKGDAGEFALEADLRSSFDVLDVVSIPTRGKGPPVLDVVVKLERSSPLNGGKKFAFGEGKGGLNTGLGEVTPKRYFFKDGQLTFVDVRRMAIRQASGEWYYQKFAEIFIMGQNIGGAKGKQMQALASELFDAARNGQIAAMVGKSNVKLDRKFIDSTEAVVSFFTSRRWDLSGGFPIPK